MSGRHARAELALADALDPVAELGPDGTTVVARFVYGTKPHVPDYMVKNGTTYRILSDHLGSVRLVVDAATGTIAQRIDYDEFGNVTGDTNPGFQPFGFAGGIHDPDTGLVRFGARDYDPEVGRWTAKDPLDFASGSVNLYEYALLDPTNLVDPEGTTPQASGGGGSGGRRVTGRAETTSNPQKKYKRDKKSGRWFYHDKRTGKKVFKPKGWVPPWLTTPLILPLPLPEPDSDPCVLNPNDPACLQACPGVETSVSGP